MKQILLATTNPAKRTRFEGILSALSDVDFIRPFDIGITSAPDEPFSTGHENARHKVTEYYVKADMPVFGSDETLYLDFLKEEQQPGVMARRLFGGRALSDQEIYDYWFAKVQELPEGSGGYFRQYFCYYDGEKYIEHVADFPFTLTKEPALPYPEGYPMTALSISRDSHEYWAKMTKDDRAALDQKKLEPMLAKLRKLYA